MITRTTTTITPAMAEEWLKNNRNRTLQKQRAEAIARDILDGKWEQRNVSIAFFEDGSLGDGQHRLKAVCIAGVPVRAAVEYGYPLNAVFDDNKSRNVRDHLVVGGCKNAHAVASITSTLARYALNYAGVAKLTTNELLLAQSNCHDEVQAAARDVMGPTHALRNSTFAAFIVCLRLFSEDGADRFLRGVIRGDSLSAGDPVLALRNRFNGSRDARFIATRPTYLWSILSRVWAAAWRGHPMAKIPLQQVATFVELDYIPRIAVQNLIGLSRRDEAVSAGQTRKQTGGVRA